MEEQSLSITFPTALSDLLSSALRRMLFYPFLHKQDSNNNNKNTYVVVITVASQQDHSRCWYMFSSRLLGFCLGPFCQLPLPDASAVLCLLPCHELARAISTPVRWQDGKLTMPGYPSAFLGSVDIAMRLCSDAGQPAKLGSVTRFSPPPPKAQSRRKTTKQPGHF